MEPRQSLTRMLTDSETTIATMLKSVSPVTAEALGYTPLDFLFIDRQHGTPVVENIEELVRTADLQDMPVVVRIPRDDASLVTILLDAGVRGIMVPQVEKTETVREISSHMRYEDGRSLGSYTRAARFGNVPKPRYAEYVNEELALLPMIETAAGLDAVEELAAMEEVTALTIGPGDLAWSLDVPFDSEAHHEALDRIYETGAAQGCPVGMFGSKAHIEKYGDRAAFFVHSSDVSVATDYFEELLGD